jgi:hypothetical protein
MVMVYCGDPIVWSIITAQGLVVYLKAHGVAITVPVAWVIIKAKLKGKCIKGSSPVIRYTPIAPSPKRR